MQHIVQHQGKFLKFAREKCQVTFKETEQQIFQQKSQKVLREWIDIPQVLKENNITSRTFYLKKLSFRMFQDKQEHKEFITTRLALQTMLKRVVQAEAKEMKIVSKIWGGINSTRIRIKDMKARQKILLT